MYFLTVPFRFSAANIRPNDMTAGMPALSAVAGMAHNLQRVVQESLEIDSFKVAAFSLVYFNLDRDQGVPRRPPQEPSGDSMVMPSLMDIRRAHGEAALIACFDIAEESEYARFAALMADQEGQFRLESAINAELRFAGGEVFIGTQGEFGNCTLGLSIAQQWDEILTTLMRAYPTQGLLIQDMSHRLSKEAVSQGVTTLKAMGDLLYRSRMQRKESSLRQQRQVHTETLEVDGAKPQPEAEQSSTADEPETEASYDDLDDLDLSTLFDYEDIDSEAVDEGDQDSEEEVVEPYLGVLLPASVGFHEVCEPRGDQHFVEPVLTLVRARVLPSVKLDLKENREDWKAHFWCWEHLPEHHLYRAVSFSHQE